MKKILQHTIETVILLLCFAIPLFVALAFPVLSSSALGLGAKHGNDPDGDFLKPLMQVVFAWMAAGFCFVPVMMAATLRKKKVLLFLAIALAIGGVVTGVMLTNHLYAENYTNLFGG